MYYGQIKDQVWDWLKLADRKNPNKVSTILLLLVAYINEMSLR